MGQHDQLVDAQPQRAEPPLARGIAHQPEVQSAVEDFAGNVARVHAAHLDLGLGMVFPEPHRDGQQHVDGRLVDPDDHPPAPQLLQLAHRVHRFVPQARHALGVIEQDRAGLRQPPGLRRSVEQPLAELVLQPADRLADRGLRAVQPGRRPREAPLGRDHPEHLKLVQFHAGLPP